MKNKVMLCAVLSAVAAASGETPVVSDVAFSYGGGRLPATVTYTLTGAPAFVTVDIETNTLADATGEWVNIGGEATGGIYGHGATLVWLTNRTAKAYWLPGESWPGQTLPAGVIRARVTAYPTNSPPDYMVVDLSSPTNRRFYSCERSLPGGIDSDLYRTNSLVMRRIPAANVVWRMGIPAGEDGSDVVMNTAHKVLLTEDYYMGVFELTQGQYSRFASNGSAFRNAENAYRLPVERITHNLLRGQTATADSPYGWPREDHAVSSSSVIGMMRSLTGLAALDLPTDAQWEYACRAGTGTPVNTGVANPTAADWNTVAWTSANSPKDTVVGKNQTHPVGTKPPNAWGLYNMHANILELCLDWRPADDADFVATFQSGWESGAVTTNPVGVAFSKTAANSPRVVKRGGSIAHAAEKGARSGYHFDGGFSYQDAYIGCRLVCPLSDVLPKPLASGEEEEVTE